MKWGTESVKLLLSAFSFFRKVRLITGCVQILCLLMYMYKLKKIESFKVVALFALLRASFGGFVGSVPSYFSMVRAKAGVGLAMIDLAIGGYITGATLPDSIAYVTNATKWANTPTAVSTLGTTVLGLVMVAAAIYAFLNLLRSSGD